MKYFRGVKFSWLYVTTKIKHVEILTLRTHGDVLARRATLFKASCSTLLHVTVYLSGTDCSLYDGNLREGVGYLLTCDLAYAVNTRVF